jgi:hypothetical protein
MILLTAAIAAFHLIQFVPLAIQLVLVHTPNGDVVEINPDQIVTMRTAAQERKEEERMFHKSVKCLINLADGKFVAVVESCVEIKALIEGAK